MLKIPTDMGSWHPNDVAEWMDGIDYEAEHGDVTADEYTAAQRAVNVAILGDDFHDQEQAGGLGGASVTPARTLEGPEVTT